jgi:hypothetical protein
MRDTVVYLPDYYRVVVCHDPDHECYGKSVQVIEGKWKNHLIHIEKLDDDCFNLKIDQRPMAFQLSYRELESRIKRSIL